MFEKIKEKITGKAQVIVERATEKKLDEFSNGFEDMLMTGSVIGAGLGLWINWRKMHPRKRRNRKQKVVYILLKPNQGE